MIRETTIKDIDIIHDVEWSAFERPEVVKLATDLLVDPSAAPLISLLYFDGEKPVGHILFTRAALGGVDSVECMILAPLAVIPEYQGKGIGKALMEEGLKLAKERGVGLVFVLGHPEYYPRAGFVNGAGPIGFEAPYPIPEEHNDAWMVAELTPGLMEGLSGKVEVASTLMAPEHWQE